MEYIRIVYILIFVGLVIFVHELGHFLVARWAGVLVERFSIGFGPVLFSFRRGDTEYALSMIPLGGYVKMLGQTDTPEVEDRIDDERSYQRKSVGKRMAIISAGVVMNILFAFVCFVIAYRMGVPGLKATIGSALPGKPAWNAGLRAGDEIVAINGDPRTDYRKLLERVFLTNPDTESIAFDVKRDGSLLHFELSPAQEAQKPQIGVLPPEGVTLVRKKPVETGSPADRATPKFESEDKVVAADGKPIESNYDLVKQLFARRNETVTVGIERGKSAQRIEIPVEPNHVKTLGLEMQISEIVAIQANSPALAAVDAENKPSPIQPKDTIVAVNGVTDLDPMRIPDLITAEAGKRVELTLLRPGTPEQKRITVYVTPADVPTWIDMPGFLINLSGEDPGSYPISVPSIGVAYRVLATVRKVAANSPAARAAAPLKPGDIVREVAYEGKDLEKWNKASFKIGDQHWPAVFWSLQFPVVESVKLTVERGGQTFTVNLAPEIDKSWPLWMRGFNFGVAEVLHQETNALAAIQLGFDTTRSSIIKLYMTLRGLVITRTLSSKLLAGPIGIAQAAYYQSENLASLIEFIALLSINLAVLNFLPIPILDGGHMVFLTYEAIRRRPPSDRIILVGNYLGLGIILTLMVYVIYLDLRRMLESWL